MNSTHGTYQLVEARHGRFLLNPNDSYVGKSLIAYGEWDEAQVRLFGQLLSPGDVAIEAGANIGSHTVPIAKAVGAQGKVYAFEPQRLVHQLLCANVALNSCHNVYAWQYAVAEAAGETEICSIPPYHEFNYGGVRLGVDHGSDSIMERVAVRTIDSLELDRADLLKVDAEGYDLRVLRGAHHTIARLRPAIFVEIQHETKEDILALLASHDYECWWYFTTPFDKTNYRSNQECIWPGPVLVSFDLLALPRERAWSVSGLLSANEAFDWNRAPLSPDNFRADLSIRNDGTR